MNFLFFDIQITGHHTEYINHIVDYLLNNNDTTNNYFFVVHQNFTTTHQHISSKADNYLNIQFIEVETSKLQGLSIQNRIKKSLNNFKTVDDYAKSLKIDVCYLLHLNVFQIALGLKKTDYKIRGILFMQFTTMKISSLKEYYFYLRRFFPFLISLRNKNIDAIFLLNDKESCEYLNKKYHKINFFKYLPDPIPKNNIIPNFSLQSEYNINTNKKVFLHFGALSKRKGIIEIIEAVNYINEELKSKISILLVGKCSDLVLENEIKEKLADLKNTNSVQIIWDNSFVSENKMNSLFHCSDIILMPYKNPEASSGILGHAMKAKKPVIGPSQGLIGKIIKEFQMGYMLNKINPISIASAINIYDSIICDKEKMDSFVKEHNPTKFSKVLLCQ